jgi:hypothetical protein
MRRRKSRVITKTKVVHVENKNRFVPSYKLFAPFSIILIPCAPAMTATTINRFEAAATNFSPSSAPPPLIKSSAGLISSAPSIVKSSSRTSAKVTSGICCSSARFSVC